MSININNNIIGFDLTEYDIELATMLANKKNTNNRFSLARNNQENKKNNIIGYLGEVAFHKIFPYMERVNNLDYDFKHNNMLIDVKTKSVVYTPQQHYECTVYKYNYNLQKNTHYVFVRIKHDFTKAYLLGIIGKKDFKDNSIEFKKGQQIGTNNYRCKDDCYNITIGQLNSLESYLKG